ncbi:energy transducer TonB [Winogradskyella sp. A2]|uniref:energy transducer TonB n=1 Tax=Winogradskyella sp. A2 TaxID=3366944 RepID=UPI00398C4EAB
MKNSKRGFNNAGQSIVETKKPRKHDANLQKNTTLYFQIGLILCLLGTYALFEMQFQNKVLILSKEKPTDKIVSIDYVKPFEVEVIEPKDTKPLPSKTLKDVYRLVEDDTPKIEKIINTPDTTEPATEPLSITAIPEIDNDIEKGELLVEWVNIEKVPVYPGCEKYDTNDERKKCMSNKISKLINRKFNLDVGSQFGISGRQRIYTQFTIDKEGNIIDIKVRGTHSVLEKEAERVINKIPKMEPGMQRNIPVGVRYTLPIMYDARD